MNISCVSSCWAVKRHFKINPKISVISPFLGWETVRRKEILTEECVCVLIYTWSAFAAKLSTRFFNSDESGILYSWIIAKCLAKIRNETRLKSCRQFNRRKVFCRVSGTAVGVSKSLSHLKASVRQKSVYSSSNHIDRSKIWYIPERAIITRDTCLV